MKTIITGIAILMTTAVSTSAGGTSPQSGAVRVGAGSYAAEPPAYKARTDEHEGFNASKMLTRKIYAVETDKQGNPRPLPTNDWWTDLLNNCFSGALWSYPAMVYAIADGVQISYPTYWNENGTEVKSRTWLRAGGLDYTASAAIAADWHDWDVEISMPASTGAGELIATLVHGNPFTVIEYKGVTPELTFSAEAELLAKTDGGVLLRIGTDCYGVWFDGSAEYRQDGLTAVVEGTSWVSVGLLPDSGDFADYSEYAVSVVRDTKVNWHYDESLSALATEWKVTAENLRGGVKAPVMQGFLPHAYKHAAALALSWDGKEYLTPRGQMKMARSESGNFGYTYRFSGMLPYYAAPSAAIDTGYDHSVMLDLMKRYAEGGSFGGDTYWGGKGLTQMALNMTFARETGETEVYEQSKAKLRAALEDWLTYTPGESTRFFAYYPRWGGMLGYDVSYDSDNFNDHHFHYGYFIYAAALLCLEDKDFRDGYGEILRMIAKDYANYDREDTRFPFLRTLDPWAGHSYAGGLGDHVNDNGNGQESSSEAMQGWGAVYMLGVALGDKEMRDAGIFGWLTESRGTAEYWFDRDHIKGNGAGNYDYTLYTSPYNTNITSKGIGWWTWFSGDALWMHSIQWMPVSPCLNYLSEDREFVKWDYETMMNSTAYRWFETSGENAPLADQSVGNVVLSYMERYDPQGAAAIFDEAVRRGSGIATSVDTGHISYFVIHNHLTYGDIDFEITADCPTANAYRASDGTMTYIVYNPDAGERRVTFSRNGTVVKQVTAPGVKMTVFTAEPVALSIALVSEEGLRIPAGGSGAVTATVLDQYGATVGEAVTTLTAEGPAAIADGVLTVNAGAADGSAVTVCARYGDLTAELELTVGEKPGTVEAAIKGIPDFAETGAVVNMQMVTTDQYGESTVRDARWEVIGPDGENVECRKGCVTPQRGGRYRVLATAGSDRAEAELTILPPLGDVAQGCTATSSSEENVGTKTENAVDGDEGTRWGSAHTDNEWLMLDLGADYRITSVSIKWEAAFAADYDVEAAPDGSDTANIDVWHTAFEQRGLSEPGWVRHSVAETARYVRVKCLRRALPYGYSIYEIKVGGIRADAASDTPVGLDIIMPQTARQGETVGMCARKVCLDGSTADAPEAVVTSDREAEIGKGSFTPVAYGLHTLTARAGELTSTGTILVDESVRLAGITVSPGQQTILTGETAYVRAEGENQFGGIYPLDPSTVDVTVTDEAGKEPEDNSVEYNILTGAFTASKRGDYMLDFAGKARAGVTVRDVSEANLAAGKPAAASTSLGGNTPDKAFDENMDTRWESEFVDDAWLRVNLRGKYAVNRVELYWEAAHAKEYSVETSTDGENWLTVHSTDAGKGGHETVTFPETPAQFVRLTCRKRALGYGNSVYEMQVYGTKRLDTETGIGESVDETVEGVATLYNLQGIRVDKMLPGGVYIRSGRKVIVR